MVGWCVMCVNFVMSCFGRSMFGIFMFVLGNVFVRVFVLICWNDCLLLIFGFVIWFVWW